MRLSRLSPLLCCATLLAGCGGSDAGTADSAAAIDTAAMAPAGGATISPADVAGRWNVRAIPIEGDTTPTTLVLVATADTTGWTTTFPNREPIPTRVTSVGGDSIVTEVGPYSSARRANVQVVTTVVWRLQGDRLVGTSVARYATTGPDSVLHLRIEGTRAQ